MGSYPILDVLRNPIFGSDLSEHSDAFREWVEDRDGLILGSLLGSIGA